MSGTILYPRGYTRTINEDGRICFPDKRPKQILKSELERSVVELYNKWVDLNTMNPDWDFKRYAFLTMSQVYGDFWDWAQTQLITNDYMYDTSKDFLLDTLQYIVTGNRVVNIINWPDLLFDYPDARPRSATAERYNLMKDIVGKNVRNNYISMWCSHERGLEDMIVSTNIFFGAATKL